MRFWYLPEIKARQAFKAFSLSPPNFSETSYNGYDFRNYKYLSCICEKIQDIFTDILNLLQDSFSGSPDYILGLRSTDILELDACLFLNHLDLALSLLCVESDASTRVACTSSTTRSVNISLCILRRFNLDYEVNVGNVETS